MLRRLAAVAFFLTFAQAADAQVGLGAGYPAGPYVGVYTGPYFGYYPGAYRGFYSNGFSLYGPPVPTYAAVPGTFGGRDQRLDTFPDLRHSWYGPYGWRGVVPLNQPSIATQRYVIARTTAVCEIRLPCDDAAVTVNGVSLAGRRFEMTLPVGSTRTVEIDARWTDSRGIAASRRSVILRPGESVVVDFTTP